MTIQTKAVLKTYFELEDEPTEEQFVDLIDSFVHVDDNYIPVITYADGSKDLALSDAGSYLYCTSATGITLTVPPQSSVAWVTGTEIVIEQHGAGQITIAAGAGVTITTPETLISAKQYATITLKQISSDVWSLAGYLEAS